MSNAKRGLEDFMNIVEESHSKTASAKKETFNASLISKLADELTKSAEEGGAAVAAATAGAAVAAATAGAKPADSTVATAAEAVVSATDAASATQLALAGANPMEVAKGESVPPTKPNEGVVITDAAGKVTDSNALNKAPASVVAAVEPTSKDESVEKTSELKRAEEIGATMARSYVTELEKIAEERQYGEALEYLQSRGVLDGYNIKS